MLNTCAVTTQAARRSRKRAAVLHGRNPFAKLILTGCYAELAPATAADLAGVDQIVGNRQKDELVAVVGGLHAAEMPTLAAEPEAAIFARGRTRAFIKVQDGCRNRCSYCVVTIARGEERSTPVADIVEQVNARYEEGFREVVLTGIHLGGYGGDSGSSLSEMIRAVLDQTPMPWIRFGSLEPWGLPAGFFSLWDDSRLCPHLHLPLQSGSDAVLRRMARRTTTAEYRALALRARERGIALTTDLILGFPGETERDFQESLDLVRELAFNWVHLFRFSPRPGTAAAKMSGQITQEVKKQRMRIAQDLAFELRSAHLARLVGASVAVHWEGRGDPVSNGWRWRGYTGSYTRVETVLEEELELRNRFERVQVVGASSGALVVARD